MKRICYLLVLFLSCELWFSAQAIASEKVLLGVFPRRNAKATIRMFTPLADYLSKESGLNVEIATAKDFPTFWKHVMQGHYDIVHYNQLHYIESHDKKGYEVFAQNEEFGVRELKSAIVVRKDVGINSINDLKNKTILFGGGKKAFISYISNVVTLQRAGLSMNDYITKFAKNPPNATIATYIKQSDAGGIGDIGLKIPLLKKKGVNVSDLKLIGVGRAFPHLPWAVNSTMDRKVKDSIKKAMLNLNNSAEGKAILNKAWMTGIHKAEDKDYDSCRKIIKEYQMMK